MTAFAGSPPNYPALVLYPLNDTFQAKNILLHQRAKIGRQSNAKTIPTERNGYFDTKVISRQHAEVWVEDGKIWIKDVKSSNGTYVNTHRLAPEGVESDPFELHTGDILELGTDIASEDNTKIVHHKVAARVTCILSPEDAAAHTAARQQPQQQEQPQGQFTFGQGGPPRRPMSQMNHMALNSMGGLGGSTRAPGTRSGLSFEHIMSKIQSELQKSRDTGSELHGLANAMNDIQDTLGGSLPIVPSQQPRAASLNGPLPPVAPAPPPPELTALQTQITETQSWIAGQVDRVKALNIDNVSSELGALRRDVDMIRELMQSQRVAQDAVTRSEGAVSPIARELAREDNQHSDDDDDDARSVSTVVPEPDRDSFDEADTEWSSAGAEHAGDAQEFAFSAEKAASGDSAEALQPLSPTRTGRSRLQVRRERDEEAARQLEAVMTLARELERQHAEATETIRALQDKVLELEARESTRALEDKVRILEGRQDAHEERASTVQHALEGVRVEWASLREDWVTERARIAKVMDDFETAKNQAVTQIVEARAPPSPPKSLVTDSDEASGDPGDESLPHIASPNKRKKNRRRKSPLRRADAVAVANETHGQEAGEAGEWEHTALLTPSSLSSSSSNARRFKNGPKALAAGDSGRSSIDSLPDVDGSSSDKADAVVSVSRAPTMQHNFTPVAGTVAVCVVALAIVYGRDLRLLT